MSDIHTYRASDTLARALTQHAQTLREWGAGIAAWDREHPDTRLLWSRSPFGHDRVLAGFSDAHPDQPPPAGLSRAKKRPELRPVRGRAGEEWNAVMERFNCYPSIDRVLRDHGVPDHVLVVDHGRAYKPGLLEINGTWWITCQVSLFEGEEHPHLARAPLSEYYAAKESAALQEGGAKQ